MIEAVNPPGAGFPGVSTATIARDGDIMILSGHVPTDDDGNVIDGDFEDQVRAVFANIGKTLKAAGVDFDAVIRLTYYIKDFEPGMLDAIKKVRGPLLSQDTPPASALISVSGMYDPKIRIEVDGFVEVPRRNA